MAESLENPVLKNKKKSFFFGIICSNVFSNTVSEEGCTTLGLYYANGYSTLCEHHFRKYASVPFISHVLDIMEFCYQIFALT